MLMNLNWFFSFRNWNCSKKRISSTENLKNCFWTDCHYHPISWIFLWRKSLNGEPASSKIVFNLDETGHDPQKRNQVRFSTRKTPSFEVNNCFCIRKAIFWVLLNERKSPESWIWWNFFEMCRCSKWIPCWYESRSLGKVCSSFNCFDLLGNEIPHLQRNPYAEFFFLMDLMLIRWVFLQTQYLRKPLHLE